MSCAGPGGPRLLFPDTTRARLEAMLGAWEGPAFFAAEEAHNLSAEEIAAVAAREGVDTLMLRTGQVRLDAAAIGRLPSSVRLINVQATGVENLDLDAAARRGISVTNLSVALYAVDEVAEFVIAMIFAAAKRLVTHDANVRGGRWRGFPAEPAMLSLAGQTLGVVGYGTVGRRVAGMGRALGWRVAVHTAHPPAEDTRHEGIEFVPLPELLGRADTVVLCVPLNGSTHHLIDTEKLALLGSRAILINVSRGAVVDEQAAARAANEGRIFCYGADVFSVEPPDPAQALLRAGNTLLTPHVAWKTRDTVREAFRLWLENATAFHAGDPVNLVCDARSPAGWPPSGGIG